MRIPFVILLVFASISPSLAARDTSLDHETQAQRSTVLYQESVGKDLSEIEAKKELVAGEVYGPKKLDTYIHEWKQTNLWKWLSETYGAAKEQIIRWFSETEADRFGLYRIRDKYIEEYNFESKKKHPSYNHITEEISKENIKWVGDIVDSIAEDLGIDLPEGFSIFTMGSLARGESGFYTDLEIGFLVPDEAYTVTNMKKMLLVANELNRRLFFLGEHPDYRGYGMRLDEAANAPLYLRFGYEDLTPEEAKKQLIKALATYDFEKIPWGGSRLFITTPTRLAENTNPNFFENIDAEDRVTSKQRRDSLLEKEYEIARADPANADISNDQLRNGIRYLVDLMEKPLGVKERRESNNIVVLGRNMENIYGDPETFNAFMEKREPYLEGEPQTNKDRYVSRRHEIAMEALRENILKVLGSPDDVYLTGKISDKLDIKRQLYRFAEQFVTNLGFYFKTQSQNPQRIIDELVERNIMGQDEAKQIKDFMNFAVGLRLKQQKALNSQAHSIYLDEDAFNKDKNKLTEEIESAERTLNFAETSGSTAETISNARKLVEEKKHELEELEKVAPGRILTASDMYQLNAIYLPEANSILLMAQRWLSGLDNALGGSGAAIGIKKAN